MGGCPWCNAPRADGPACPRCGANYAKAELIKQQGRAAAPAPAPRPAPAPLETYVEPEDRVDDAALEYKLCVAAIPAALAIAVLLTAFGLSRAVLRLPFTMPVHELGHAVTAWFCGFMAIPTLWKTIIPEERGVVAPVLLFAALAFLVYRAEPKPLKALGVALIVLQGFCTFGLGESTAEMLFIFGGDGMGMVLATLLMASFFFGKKTQLYKGSLRWGFLVIGAVAFMDMFSTWVASRNDFGNIPFGENEGSGPSDAWKLTEDFGWTAEALVRRYLLLGSACLAALAAVYAWGVWQAKRLVTPS